MAKTNKILDKLSKKEGERVKTSLYLDERLYKKFKKVCLDNNQSTSRVLEEVIRNFLSELK